MLGERTVSGKPAQRRTQPARRLLAHVLIPALILAAVPACSSNGAPSAGGSGGTPTPPSPPDPCSVLTTDQITQAFDAAGQPQDVNAQTSTQDSYSPDEDEIGMTVDCKWSTPQTFNGLTAVFEILWLVIAPDGGYPGAPCVTKVSGLGQAACVSAAGTLQIEDGPFEVDLTDYVPHQHDLTLDKQLAAEALAAIDGAGTSPSAAAS